MLTHIKFLILQKSMALKLTGQFVNCVAHQRTKKDGSTFEVFEGTVVVGSFIYPVKFAENVSAEVGQEISLDVYAKYDDFRKQIVFIEKDLAQ